jgi:hypothetical protein
MEVGLFFRNTNVCMNDYSLLWYKVCPMWFSSYLFLPNPFCQPKNLLYFPQKHIQFSRKRVCFHLKPTAFTHCAQYLLQNKQYLRKETLGSYRHVLSVFCQTADKISRLLGIKRLNFIKKSFIVNYILLDNSYLLFLCFKFK